MVTTCNAPLLPANICIQRPEPTGPHSGEWHPKHIRPSQQQPRWISASPKSTTVSGSPHGSSYDEFPSCLARTNNHRRAKAPCPRQCSDGKFFQIAQLPPLLPKTICIKFPNPPKRRDEAYKEPSNKRNNTSTYCINSVKTTVSHHHPKSLDKGLP